MPGKKKVVIDGLERDSKEEVYAHWWFQELKDAGYIHSFDYQPQRFKVFESITAELLVFQERKRIGNYLKKEERQLHGALSYTPDYLVRWNHSAETLFVEFIGMPLFFKDSFLCQGDSSDAKPWWRYSYFDVKPDAGFQVAKHDGIRRLNLNRAMMFRRYEIYINMFQPLATFKRTFCPQRYRLTDKTKKKRVKTDTLNSLGNYIAERTIELDKLKKLEIR